MDLMIRTINAAPFALQKHSGLPSGWKESRSHLLLHIHPNSQQKTINFARACKRSKIKQMNLQLEHNRATAKETTTATTIGKLGTLWVIAAGAHEKLSWL